MPTEVTIKGIRTSDGFRLEITVTGSRAENAVASILREACYNLPVVPFRLEGEIPGLSATEGTEAHPHVIREELQLFLSARGTGKGALEEMMRSQALANRG
jgi:hypothetical protein